MSKNQKRIITVAAILAAGVGGRYSDQIAESVRAAFHKEEVGPAVSSAAPTAEVPVGPASSSPAMASSKQKSPQELELDEITGLVKDHRKPRDPSLAARHCYQHPYDADARKQAKLLIEKVDQLEANSLAGGIKTTGLWKGTPEEIKKQRNRYLREFAKNPDALGDMSDGVSGCRSETWEAPSYSPTPISTTRSMPLGVTTAILPGPILGTVTTTTKKVAPDGASSGAIPQAPTAAPTSGAPKVKSVSCPGSGSITSAFCKASKQGKN